MNKKQHLIVAIAILTIFYFLLGYFNLLSYIGYTITILLGAVLPDFIEPARSFNHRRFFHSRRFLKLLYFFLPILIISGIYDRFFFYILFLVIGYISHLWMDFFTRKGLPK